MAHRNRDCRRSLSGMASPMTSPCCSGPIGELPVTKPDIAVEHGHQCRARLETTALQIRVDTAVEVLCHVRVKRTGRGIGKGEIWACRSCAPLNATGRVNKGVPMPEVARSQ